MLMKKTNVVVKVDSDLWKQFMGLAALKKVDRQELLEEAIRDRLKKEAGKK